MIDATTEAHDTINMAIDYFYSHLDNEPLLSLYFDGVNLDALKPRLASFLRQMTEDSDRTSDAMTLSHVHRSMNISDMAFDQFVAGLTEGLRESGASKDSIERLTTVLESYKNDVVGSVAVPAMYVIRPSDNG
jgi:truncated hemoglobin YjbI